MIDFLIDIDTKVFLFLNDINMQLFYHFMMAFTGKAIWVPMYATILFILYRRFGWRVATCYVIGITIAITITDQVCASYIRPFVERLRPSNLANPISGEVHIVDGYRGGSYGFPSCHAANSFALATFLSLLFASRRFTIFILTWAVLNSYSRLYLGVHYPGDLIVGGIVGAIVGWGTFLSLRQVAIKVSRPNKYIRKPASGLIPIGNYTYAYHLSDIMIIAGCTISFFILAYAFMAWAGLFD
ncbi:MAG: phosphatase PAP2 family protein [Muribaculaceae bacterium]|nr:phosphatase PAP2 family protein [Muribaculaceae bacterium]